MLTLHFVASVFIRVDVVVSISVSHLPFSEVIITSVMKDFFSVVAGDT